MAINVDLKVKDYCQGGCRYFKPEVTIVSIYGNDREQSSDNHVVCQHAKACEMWYCRVKEMQSRELIE